MPCAFTESACAKPICRNSNAFASASTFIDSASFRCVSSRAPDSPSACAFMRSTSRSVTCNITVASSTFCIVFCLITSCSCFAVSIFNAASALAVASFTSFWYSCCFSSRSRRDDASEVANSLDCTFAFRACSASTISASALAFATVCRAEDSFRARPSSASRFTAAVCVAPSAAMYPSSSSMFVTVYDTSSNPMFCKSGSTNSLTLVLKLARSLYSSSTVNVPMTCR
mmetsp:Transcript_355/g.1184  ORF Transcript_355/g.1184 Transcript_355/m.1184 type:complete len:228 (-) Transcript_355:421-1104(-)